jgi:transcriptional regulator with XRE-family HTH domain
MGTLAERLKGKKFALGVKQHAAVLEYTTAIEDEMNARSMSQQQLADLLGKSRNWVWKILRKKPNLTFFTAVEVADALGLDLDVNVRSRATASVTPRGEYRFVGRPVFAVIDGGAYSAPTTEPIRDETTVIRAAATG